MRAVRRFFRRLRWSATRRCDVRAKAGRLLSPADDRTSGAHSVVVVSDVFARRAFTEPGNAVGRTLVLNNHAFTIVGIAAEGFGGT